MRMVASLKRAAIWSLSGAVECPDLSLTACAGSSPWRSARAAPLAICTKRRREVLGSAMVDARFVCCERLDRDANNHNIKCKYSKVNWDVSLSFGFDCNLHDIFGLRL